jgi:YegS/Rv2252/BmrU family lipid kinase
VIVILNCGSGTTQSRSYTTESVAEALRQEGLHADVWCTGPGETVMHLAQRAAASGDDTIVAAGGDGTISAVAGALADTPKRLGVLPLGTLNHFARDLKIPTALAEAIKTLAAGHERRVDVGEVNGRVFLNNSSLGLYPRIVRHRTQQQERLGRRKWPAFALAALSALRVLPLLRLRFTADGVERQTRTPFFFIGNNEYHMQGLRIGERDRLDAGSLHAYYAANAGRWGLFALAARSLVGRVTQANSFEMLAARELIVQPRRPTIDVSLDGEVCHLTAPLRYRIRPQALRVIGPP